MLHFDKTPLLFQEEHWEDMRVPEQLPSARFIPMLFLAFALAFLTAWAGGQTASPDDWLVVAPSTTGISTERLTQMEQAIKVESSRPLPVFSSHGMESWRTSITTIPMVSTGYATRDLLRKPSPAC